MDEQAPFVTVRQNRNPDEAAEYEPLTYGEEEGGQFQDQQYDDVQQQYQSSGDLQLEEPDAEQQLDDYEAQERQDELLATEVEAAEYRDEQAAQFDQYYADEGEQEEVIPADEADRADSGRLSVRSADDMDNYGGNMDDTYSSKEKLTDRLQRRKSSYDATMATPSEKEAYSIAMDAANREVGPGLDMMEEEEDEEVEEVWIPPSMELAQEHIEKNVYQEGKGKFWRGDLTKATDLSRGVVLHFSFLRNMAVCMSVMTLLSIPSLLFCTTGTRIPLALQDPIGSYNLELVFNLSLLSLSLSSSLSYLSFHLLLPRSLGIISVIPFTPPALEQMTLTMIHPFPPPHPPSPLFPNIPPSSHSPIGLYKFTLGNIGYDPNSRTYLTDSACTQGADAKTYNGTCIHFQVCILFSTSFTTSFKHLVSVPLFKYYFSVPHSVCILP